MKHWSRTCNYLIHLNHYMEVSTSELEEDIVGVVSKLERESFFNLNCQYELIEQLELMVSI